MSTLPEDTLHGGTLVGEVLAQQGVQFLYTLCGGHISPILVGAQDQGIRVVDVRHEVTAVFAADATARLTGTPGVAAVTAGPGVTNTITALKNAQMAQSPVVLIGGAAATILKGRGALQDIDHLSVVKSLVKWSKAVTKVRQIVPALEMAFQVAQEGVPGPVFVEIPINLLYPQNVIKALMVAEAGKSKGLLGKATHFYLNHHVNRTFAQAWDQRAQPPLLIDIPEPTDEELQKVTEAVANASNPVLIVGSQALVDSPKAAALQEAIISLGVPTFLSGMARGLLGKYSLHIRHKRSQALRAADVILLAGVPCDFRLGYGRIIPRKATYIAINRSKQELNKNRKPTIGIQADAGAALRQLANQLSAETKNRWKSWHESLLARDAEHNDEIDRDAQVETDFVNPVRLCQQIEEVLDPDSIIIGDGGDFVGTASYIVRPRGPLSWLDPGAFGTLGSGGGFALAAKLCRPNAETWLLYGDGSAGYSLAEFDTYARHNVPVIAIVGNDGSWAQIAREQVEILGTPLGTELAQTDYHKVAEGYGGVGLFIDSPKHVASVLAEAKQIARSGRPVLVNVLIGHTDFRKGSISM